MKSNLQKNIVLIGMPGCGKTTIGRLLAQRLNINFCDVDEYIENKEKMSISDIFKKGEIYFRKVEREAVIDIVKKDAPMIIATGGGVIKKESNMIFLKENSMVIFVDRPLENIISDIDMITRPLLKDGISKIYELYSERYELYKKYCDYEIVNSEEPQKLVEEIIRLYKEE